MNYQPQTGLHSVPQKDKAKKEKVLQRQRRKPHSPLQIKQIRVMEKSSHPNQLLPGHATSKDNFQWEPQLQSQASLNKKNESNNCILHLHKHQTNIMP